MPDVVVDASAVVEVVARRPAAAQVESAFEGFDMHAPVHVDAEVVNALRSLAMRGDIGPQRADEALTDAIAFPLNRMPLAALMKPAWQLRHNLTAYDALYVALAEGLACPLLTADRRLAAVPGLPVTVIVAGA